MHLKYMGVAMRKGARNCINCDFQRSEKFSAMNKSECSALDGRTVHRLVHGVELISHPAQLSRRLY